MMEYPSGLQTLHEFKALLGLQGLDQKANQHIDQVYNTFDMNKVRPCTFHLTVSIFSSFLKYKIGKMCASHWMGRSSEDPQLVGKGVIKHI